MSGTRVSPIPPQVAPASLMVRGGIGFLFFLSGAIALIYEGAWQREFALLFGSAAPATAAVLAAYFAGLGLGAFLLGKLSARFKRPLLVYAFLELLIALGALLVSPLLNLYSTFYPNLFQNFQGHALFLWIKGALAFLSIALPTFAMGGTLPILAKIFEADRAHIGESAGWLYLLNTIGAAVGALSFPILLGAAGLKASTDLCVVGNVGIALIAFVLSRKLPAASPLRSKPQTTETSFRIVRFCLALAFVSGFATFSLQVAWNRAFAQVHENSVQSFTLIVALFILAIALGAEISRLLLRRRVPWQRAFGMCWTGAALLLLLTPATFISLTDGLRFLPASSTAMFNPHLFLPGVVLMLPVALIAVSLPLLFHALAQISNRSVADLTGQTLALNIAGSIAGALLAGFVFPRYLGIWNSILLCAVVIAAGGFTTLVRARLARLASIGVAAAVAFFLSRADLPRTRIESSRGDRLIRVLEGTHGIVAVVDRGADKATSRRLKLNNHYILGGTSATGDERLQGHIPLLLHPNPKSVAYLGYGTGITASSALFYSISNVVAVELVPEVVQVARDYFFDTAFSEKYPVLIEDARNYLRGTTNRFDIVIGDLVVPWRQGEGALYTLEHFQTARRRLNDSGTYCCWLPMFQLSRDDFELIARTFLQVFPHTQVWRGDFSPREPALALVGSVNPLPVGAELSRMQPDPSNPHLNYPSAFWMHFVGIITNLAAGPLNREDRPVIELRSGQPVPFIGRALAQWEGAIRAQSTPLEQNFSADQRAGWAAGSLMREFTLLLSENRRSDAEKVAQQIRSVLGEEVAQTVLGP